jgi:hypothetical protein
MEQHMEYQPEMKAPIDTTLENPGLDLGGLMRELFGKYAGKPEEPVVLDVPEDQPELAGLLFTDLTNKGFLIREGETSIYRLSPNAANLLPPEEPISPTVE